MALIYYLGKNILKSGFIIKLIDCILFSINELNFYSFYLTLFYD